MPMIPSFFAAATYTAIKVGGYYYFGSAVNKKLEQNFPPLKFAFIKVASGFVGGFLFLMAFSALVGERDPSDFEMLLILFPVRYIIWFFVLGRCYKLFERKSILVFASLLGTLVSYFLDLIMWALFGILPGMQMGIC
ncbi:MAG: hypothetical protein ACEQSE_04530 [Candidatus Aquirickettsiella gammari]